jgi:hypothetical protein
MALPNSRRPVGIRRRTAGSLGAMVLVVVAAGCGVLAGGAPAGQLGTAPSLSGPAGSYSSTGVPGALSPSPNSKPTSTPTQATSGFVPIDMFAVDIPSSVTHPDFHATDAPFHPSDARPIPSQPRSWLTEKAAGRVALVAGKIVLLDPITNPLLVSGTSNVVPIARTLDVSWSRWIVEPTGRGVDEMGVSYTDRSYWNFCGPGSTAVTLYYWQQLTGHPNVTGTSGYFLDPYTSEGVPWPSPGPALPMTAAGKRLGTYWSGSDTVSGFTAHARGFVMYMGTKIAPPTWTATGMSVWADDTGHGYYPTRGSSLGDIQTGINWEISGHDANNWLDSWYGSVNNSDPTLARDLQAAVMLDVGRDGVPVVAAVDTFDLPNWQKGSATPHTRHAVSIVGYNNAANPPTYSYIDTCGRACNPRGGNTNGQVHVISQAKMVASLTDAVGIGFSW